MFSLPLNFRRRDDPANFADPTKPGLGARSSALLLAALLKGSLEIELPPSALETPQQQQQGQEGDRLQVVNPPPSASGGADVADAMAVDPSPAAAVSAPLAAGAVKGGKAGTLPSNNHLGRLAEEVSTVLFDSRRRSCHVLILNYFVALGGLDSLLACFSQVWALGLRV